MKKIFPGVSLLIVVFLLTAAGSPLMADVSYACTFFGPDTFYRTTGAPNIYQTEIYTEGYEETYVLHLRNGDEQGNYRISSAEVLLNGQVLFGPQDFNQQVAGYDTVVQLSDTSNLVLCFSVNRTI